MPRANGSSGACVTRETLSAPLRTSGEVPHQSERLGRLAKFRGARLLVLERGARAIRDADAGEVMGATARCYLN
jgi:hypothetical protein